MDQIEDVTFILKQADVLYSVFKLAFTKNDSSLYVFPYGVNGRYFFGREPFPAQQISHSFGWKSLFYEQKPKLSIHESGQVHIKTNDGCCSDRVWTKPLSEFRGEHLASVVPDAIDACPVYKKTIKTTGPSRTIVIPAGDRVEGIRLIIYANAEAPEFSVHCPVIISMKRETTVMPIHIGVHLEPQKTLGDGQKKGTSVIAGWYPGSGTQETPFLFLRAE